MIQRNWPRQFDSLVIPVLNFEDFRMCTNSLSVDQRFFCGLIQNTVSWSFLTGRTAVFLSLEISFNNERLTVPKRDVMFCLQSYQGLEIDKSLVY